MRRAVAESNICPALSVKQGAKCQISATGDWREARAPGRDYISDGSFYFGAIRRAGRGSCPTQIAALGWQHSTRSSGIDTIGAVSLTFRFGRRQNNPG